METRPRPVLQRLLIAATTALLLVPAVLVFADALPQIDVHARRKIEKSVDSYLFEVAHASPGANDQPMMRWTVPICPMVSGFPHGLGQALFDHFTDVIDSLERPRWSDCRRYQTDEASRSQRSTIINHMVADLAH